MENLIEVFSASSQFKEWFKASKAQTHQLVIGLAGSAKTLAIKAFFKEKKQPMLVVVPNLYYANNMVDDLRNVLPEEQIHLFPVDEMVAAEMAFSSPEFSSERIATLDFLSDNQTGIVVVPLAGARKWLPSPDLWKQVRIQLGEGADLDVESLPKKLIHMGYVREQMVARPGEFSIRGGIVDIYPLTADYPFRIELFDTEIESIRQFDAESQRSIQRVDSAVISPAKDLFFTEEQLQDGAKKLAERTKEYCSKISDQTQKAFVESYYEGLTDEWTLGNYTEEMRYFADILYKEKFTIFDYLAESGYVFVDDYSRLMESERELVKDEAEWMVQKLEEQRVIPNLCLAADMRKTFKQVQQPITYFSLFQKGMGNLRFQGIYTFEYRAMQQFFGQLPLLKAETDRWHKQKQTVVVLVPNAERSKKMEELFIDAEIRTVVNHAGALIPGQLQIVMGQLQAGFELPKERLVVVTEKEILHATTKKRARKTSISNAERLKDYNELKPGDYVVHANHGIGQYIGMETLEVDGVHQDYMTILYQNNDKLFIPVTQLDLIQKYVASESKSPRINKLGGSEWSKTKKKVSAKIEDIADDLIKLYAQREAERGYAFSPDDAYQKEFEDAFPYSETEDQLRSTVEIKKDMEKEKSMDRLLVGDVGYGKTEVALRAAFKAIQDGKQVAFLVPTTILAQQHYETMVDRFAAFPISVGLMSRFRTRKQQKETIEGLKKGQIDIVVGTHRLLSQDIEFQDLGLLVIDEEQRFGVKHKERLKQLRAKVDVLTLTATPIPRTLHMSMLGVRDLSVIETPPANRYPIQTYVMEKNVGAVREGIEREIARGGQIFYLHNRVDTIIQKVDELQELVPEARIAHAHGQMTEIQLENVLFDFISGEYDILVTTTIIETGVDIPNANTLFVENADHMGLSQLYQLRGRVGRSNRIAYAYFMYEPQKILTEVSEKRLQAIKDFTELGSGFKIAMRDLSIRGAGNLLGAQQHGFIDSVGFDMYTQMLNEAVARKQGVAPEKQKTVVEIDLEVDAYLPNSYIQDERQKIEIYKRIRQLENEEMYEEIESDLLDRFGEYPDQVAHLLTIGLIKMHSEAAMIQSIRRKQQKISFTISKTGRYAYNVEQIFEALSSTKLKADLGMDGDKILVHLRIEKNMDEAIWLNEIVQFVSALRKQKYQMNTSPHSTENGGADDANNQ